MGELHGMSRRNALLFIGIALVLSTSVWVSRAKPVTEPRRVGAAYPKPGIDWVGGGRRGPTEEEAQARLDAVFESVFRGQSHAELYKLATDTSVLQETIVSLATRLGPSPDEPADDCVVHLASHSTIQVGYSSCERHLQGRR